MLPYSSKLSKKYAISVNIVKKIDTRTNTDVVTVFSHGESISQDWNIITKNGTTSSVIEDALSRMVEVNKLASST